MSVQNYDVLYDEAWNADLTENQKSKVRTAIGAADVDVVGHPYPDVDKTKLAGIQAGAEVNVQSNWDTTDTADDSYIQNKPAMILLTPDNNIKLSESNGTLNIGLAISTGTYEVIPPENNNG